MQLIHQQNSGVDCSFLVFYLFLHQMCLWYLKSPSPVRNTDIKAQLSIFNLKNWKCTYFVLKLQCFLTMPQCIDTSEDFTQICTKQMLNASVKTCFINWVENSIFVGFAASYKTYPQKPYDIVACFLNITISPIKSFME